MARRLAACTEHLLANARPSRSADMTRAGERVVECKAALDAWSLEAMVPDALLDALRTSTESSIAVCYVPSVCEHGWRLDGFGARGVDSDRRGRAFRSTIEKLSGDEPFLANYDPYAVAESQRNVALSLRDLRRLGMFDRMRQRAAQQALNGTFDQLRVLLCDGPRALGWIGVLREEPFAKGDAALLQQLAEPLRRRFRLEHQLRRDTVAGSALEHVLEALATPVFVLGPALRIEHVNAAGRQRLARARAELFEDLRRSVAAAPDAPFEVSPLLEVASGYCIAIGRRELARGALALARARDAWSLTPKQLRVLELVAAGRSNKEVASAMGNAEVTVELHMTRLFRASGTHSRTELLSKLAQL